jgi:hypothetical protein
MNMNGGLSPMTLEEMHAVDGVAFMINNVRCKGYRC